MSKKERRIKKFTFWAKTGLFFSGLISAVALIPASIGDLWTGIILVLVGNLMASFSAVAYGRAVRSEFGG